MAKRQYWMEPDDAIITVIILGCFCLLAAGKDGVIVHILTISVGAILGRLTKNKLVFKSESN